MPASTLSLWTLSICLNGIASIVLFPKAKHFRAFWLFIAASAARSLWLLSAATPQDRDRYIWIASHTTPWMIAIEVAAVIGIYMGLTENFPRWKVAGSLFLAGLAALGLIGGWLLRGVGVPADWTGTWQAAYALQRHWMVILAITLLAMRRLLVSLSSPYLPVRPITQRAADCLALSIAMHATVAAAVMSAGAPSPTWVRCLGPLAGVVNGVLWTMWLPRATENCAAYTAPTQEEYDDAVEMVNWGLATLKGRIQRMH